MDQMPEPPQRRSCVKEWMKGTQLCKFHVRGKCKRGADCNFAHDYSKLKERPNFEKTRLCPQLLAHGKCYNWDACTFAHSGREMKIAAQRKSASERRVMSGGRAEYWATDVNDEGFVPWRDSVHDWSSNCTFVEPGEQEEFEDQASSPYLRMSSAPSAHPEIDLRSISQAQPDESSIPHPWLSLSEHINGSALTPSRYGMGYFRL
eukprot:TRINITY_DN12092_c0_g2_i1.p1 TRINITY_DN12092_c0_g2~~TRINITY_DN12092_c0_g2_i1.p1  ORF type:complete len:205 (+),score=38.35 TRINITY_DN12092_c0_g2_i1:96-710(+)